LELKTGTDLGGLGKFGKKIFDKVYEKMHPEFPDEVAFSPFDLWDGANFKLKIRRVDDYRNYDKSEFSDKSALFEGDDEKLEGTRAVAQAMLETTDAYTVIGGGDTIEFLDRENTLLTCV
jgi:hypothetical protein